MRVSIIVAVDRGGVIGKDNALPWRLPADLRRFRRLTMGKPIIMGRKTHESIGKPLDGRQNIVLSRQPALRLPGCEVASTVEEALRLAEPADEVMVIGGESIYEALLPRTDRILLTVVQGHFDGDARFPELDDGEWREVEREVWPADEKNAYECHFVERVRARSEPPPA